MLIDQDSIYQTLDLSNLGPSDMTSRNIIDSRVLGLASKAAMMGTGGLIALSLAGATYYMLREDCN